MSYTKQKVKKDEWKIELKPISQLHREIQRLVGQAADLIPPVWPIHSFTSFNPLVGLLSMKFEEAFALGRRYFSSHQKDHQIYSVNQELIKWCQTFLDEGQACITMPERSKGFYLAWSSLAPYDKKLNTLSASRSWLFSLPKEPEVTIVYCLEKLKVQENQRVDFFRHCLAELPGWAGYIKWKSEWQEKKGASKYPISLVDFLAVRLVITCILAPKLDDKYFQTHLESTHLDLEKVVKREKDFITGLIQNIIPQAKAFIHEHKKTQRCDAQLIFCMDTRSEPFRRSIEQIGNYETFGTAGFFGLPILVHQSHTNRTEHRCPVFLKPHYHICEQPVNQDLKGNIIEKLKKIYSDLKSNFATQFPLVDTIGLYTGIWTGLRTLAPLWSAKVKQALLPPSPTKLHMEQEGTQWGIPLQDQITHAESALHMIGLTENFSPLILFCGHASAGINNPYATSLQCGACGGNQGGTNAKIIAEILNKKEVRASLKHRGILIPDDTIFLAAEHNTSNDELTIYQGNSPSILLEKLTQNLKQAGRLNSSQRCHKFGLNCSFATALKEVLIRSSDWSEVRSEWGLARNGAFIIGPRALTHSLNLDGRCFLHSYDWRQDAKGEWLEKILTGPFKVAHSINLQYFFSTLDNISYGSGSKITQNMTGKIGMMQGNSSDLMHGLPLESVHYTDSEEYHDPIRLQVIVYAPYELVVSILKRQSHLKKILKNMWAKAYCYRSKLCH